MSGGAATDRPASHDIEGTHNFRDVGGVRTAGGQLVPPGTLFLTPGRLRPPTTHRRRRR
ncbi:MAG: tyrosine-protein phosphatase [Acidimicrobiia bacterium]|nr:tyrosine-protein phosphatase [Acidimicrobiia bacterium]